MNRSSNSSHRRAFSLVEVTISLVLVAGLMLAAAGTVGTTASMRRLQSDRTLGVAIAQDLAGEIIRTRYEDPDGTPVFGNEPDDAGPGRSAFDDVDDYDDWVASPPRDRGGDDLPGLRGWTRAVDVVYCDPVTPSEDAPGVTDTGLKRITVTVTAPDGNVSTFVGLRSRIGSYDQDPVVASNLVSWVGITMQLGPDADHAVNSGVHIANQLPQND